MIKEGKRVTVIYDAALSLGDDEIRQSNLMAGELLIKACTQGVNRPMPGSGAIGAYCMQFSALAFYRSR
jgi:hypothetical protein